MGRVDPYSFRREALPMSRLTRSCAVLAACAVVAVPATAANADAGGPTATAAKKCSLTLTQQRNLGATYVVSLSANGVSCRGARSVVKSFHKCRLKNGASGRCVTRFDGWGCSEIRTNQLPGVSFDATATCRKGDKKVVQKYQQNI